MGQNMSCCCWRCYDCCCSRLDAVIDDELSYNSNEGTTNNVGLASSTCNTGNNVNSSSSSSGRAGGSVTRSRLKSQPSESSTAVTASATVDAEEPDARTTSSPAPPAPTKPTSATSEATGRKKSLRRCSSLADRSLFGDLPDKVSQPALSEILLLRGMVRSGLLPLRSYYQIVAEIVECDQLQEQEEQQHRRQLQNKKDQKLNQLRQQCMEQQQLLQQKKV